MRIPHELQDEFPDETVLIARLTKANYLFRVPDRGSGNPTPSGGMGCGAV